MISISLNQGCERMKKEQQTYIFLRIINRKTNFKLIIRIFNLMLILERRNIINVLFQVISYCNIMYLQIVPTPEVLREFSNFWILFNRLPKLIILN